MHGAKPTSNQLRHFVIHILQIMYGHIIMFIHWPMNTLHYMVIHKEDLILDVRSAYGLTSNHILDVLPLDGDSGQYI